MLLLRVLGTRAQRVILSASPAEVRAIHEAQIVVDLSGDMLTDSQGLLVAFSHAQPLILALLAGRPLFLCAQSLGPYTYSRPLFARILARASAITIREDETIDVLAESGISNLNLTRTADLSFLLQPREINREDVGARGVSVQIENLRATSSGVVGVSISRLFAGTLERRDPSDTPFVKRFAEVLDQIVQETGLSVLFVAHVQGPSRRKDDFTFGQEVASQMKGTQSIQHVRPSDALEAKEIIRQCDAFLGARMHANMAALHAGVPTVALGYSHKSRGIMHRFGQTSLVVGAEPHWESVLLRKFTDVWSNRNQISREVREAARVEERHAALNMDVFAQLVERGQPSGIG